MKSLALKFAALLVLCSPVPLRAGPRYCLPDHIEKRVVEVLQFAASTPAVHPDKYRGYHYDGGATREDFVETLYRSGIVAASPVSAALYNKELNAEVFKRVLGARFNDFFPDSSLDSEFLCQHQIDQRPLTRAGLIRHLRERFPSGVIAKTLESEGDEGTVFLNGFEDVAEYLEQLSANRSTRAQSYLLQEKVGNSAVLDKKANMTEVRVHTFWDDVIEEISLERWGGKITPDEKRQAHRLVRDFLAALPSSLTARQGWALDVAVRNGEAKIIDINTNRGEQISWSGFLSHPLHLMRFAEYLERKYQWRFESWPARRLRRGLANWGEACGKLFGMIKSTGLSLRPRW